MKKIEVIKLSTVLILISLCLIWIRCKEPDKTKNGLFKQYLLTLDKNFFSGSGKNVLIISNTNSCYACVREVDSLRVLLTDNKILFIYSVENKGMVDVNTINKAKKENNVFFDFNNTPFKKGFVNINPVVYFVSDGDINRVRELKGFPLAELRKEIDIFFSSQ